MKLFYQNSSILFLFLARRRIDLLLRLSKKFWHHHDILKRRHDENQENKYKRTLERWRCLLISRDNNKTLKELLIKAHERQFQTNVQKRREKLETTMRRTNEKFMQYKANQVRKRYKHFHKENVKVAMQNGIKAMAKKKKQKCRRMQKRLSKQQMSSCSIESKEFGSEKKLVVLSEPKSILSSQESAQESFYSITTVIILEISD